MAYASKSAEPSDRLSGCARDPQLAELESWVGGEANQASTYIGLDGLVGLVSLVSLVGLVGLVGKVCRRRQRARSLTLWVNHHVDIVPFTAAFVEGIV